VIPARGGSKRIPRKNIREFLGKPIIAYSIETAIASLCFDKIIVSTDDEEIAQVARLYGAEVPFLRPKELSNDVAGTVEVIQHAVSFYESSGQLFDQICCIYATAPFIEENDLINSSSLLRCGTDVDYVFPVTSFPYPIQRALSMSDDGRVDMIQPENSLIRSQELVEAYHDVGQFYWGTAEAFLAARPIVGGSSKAVIIPRERAQDIDTEEDWAFAEQLYRNQQSLS